MKYSASIALIVAALGLLWFASARNVPLLHMREAHGLTSAAPLDNAPPLVAFTTIALGGFRGLLADVLWLRASHLQARGRYFEIVQLADWITKLEPRCTEIWAFHAWNMAYNISVTMSEEEDRWRWVENGIRLLRDEALLYNPGDPGIYFELGWIFQNKIGGITDATQEYYKMRWIVEMTRLLGGPRPDYDKLRADPRLARHLRKDYGLDLDIMQEVDSRYGPLDWRLAQTHAVYWAHRGRQKAEGHEALRCDRMLYQSMSQLLSRGRLIIDQEKQLLVFEARPDLLPKVRAIYESAIRTHGENVLGEPYAYFLADAIRLLHSLGHTEEARQVFTDLHSRYPSPTTDAGFESFVAAASETTR